MVCTLCQVQGRRIFPLLKTSPKGTDRPDYLLDAFQPAIQSQPAFLIKAQDFVRLSISSIIQKQAERTVHRFIRQHNQHPVLQIPTVELYIRIVPQKFTQPAVVLLCKQCQRGNRLHFLPDHRSKYFRRQAVAAGVDFPRHPVILNPQIMEPAIGRQCFRLVKQSHVTVFERFIRYMKVNRYIMGLNLRFPRDHIPLVSIVNPKIVSKFPGYR